ncbi:hypothetical protein BV210_14595 [Halorientalis sp. IM1011]|uniref:DUF6230 family protein n=1 Tax=Halorientalis sp. IM1011 TaxID=1932360 RepID=UPI00097CD617|nr:DUF6230 family protein [Halorientalis sp. IM1011]AQL43857.1 hypothetical protein BV210_14595 [Halorientalis sp. IM1011]
MYDKSLLAKSTGVSLGVIAVVGLLFLSTGTGLAVPVAGIGGFTIEADSIEGDDLVLYPDVVERDEGTDAPQAIMELQANRIEGLRLVKTIDMGELSLDAFDGTARITIESGGTVETDQILIRSTGLNASEASFSGLRMRGTDSDDLTETFQITAPSEPVEGKTVSLDGGENPGIEMTDAEIHATYLATNRITLPELELRVQYDTDDDGEYEYG